MQRINAQSHHQYKNTHIKLSFDIKTRDLHSFFGSNYSPNSVVTSKSSPWRGFPAKCRFGAGLVFLFCKTHKEFLRNKTNTMIIKSLNWLTWSEILTLLYPQLAYYTVNKFWTTWLSAILVTWKSWRMLL